MYILCICDQGLAPPPNGSFAQDWFGSPLLFVEWLGVWVTSKKLNECHRHLLRPDVRLRLELPSFVAQQPLSLESQAGTVACDSGL